MHAQRFDISNASWAEPARRRLPVRAEILAVWALFLLILFGWLAYHLATARTADTVVAMETGLPGELDDSDARVAIALAEADLAHALRQVRALHAATRGLRAQLVSREAELALASLEVQRARAEFEDDRSIFTRNALQGAESRLAAARAAATAAREQLSAHLARIEGANGRTE